MPLDLSRLAANETALAAMVFSAVRAALAAQCGETLANEAVGLRLKNGRCTLLVASSVAQAELRLRSSVIFEAAA